jgi:hypothetical protein
MQMQKRWMRSFLRKPKKKNINIREHVARVREINSYFPLYPMMDNAKKKTEGLDNNQPFGSPRIWMSQFVAERKSQARF